MKTKQAVLPFYQTCIDQNLLAFLHLTLELISTHDVIQNCLHCIMNKDILKVMRWSRFDLRRIMLNETYFPALSSILFEKCSISAMSFIDRQWSQFWLCTSTKNVERLMNIARLRAKLLVCSEFMDWKYHLMDGISTMK